MPMVYAKITLKFLELASYGVNDVDAARGSRCGFHGALFYTKAFLHAHGINWTAETKRKQEDDAAAADNDPMPLLAWKLKSSAPRPPNGPRVTATQDSYVAEACC